MSKIPVSLIVITVFVTACSSRTEEPSVVSKDINIETMPWTENKSPISVALYDLAGEKIESTETIQEGQEYEVVIKTEKPLAIFLNSYYSFDLISSDQETLSISDTHKFRVRKTDTGVSQLIIEVYPMYYVDDVLTHEKPQSLMFPAEEN